MSDARVRHFMSETVATIRPDLPVVEVAQRMRDARMSCVVVCEGTKPVGVISERDITRLCADALEGHPPGVAADVMSKGVLTLTTEAHCADAVDMLREHRIRRLVIVDVEGNLKGIITQTDLLRAHTHELEMQKELLEERVALRTRELQEANERLEGISRIDPLLGIGNRRAMDEELAKLTERCKRYGRSYSVALLDVDHFKKYNDHYGHGAGDTVLQTVAQTIAQNIRAADTVYRYGGEEFLMLYPEVGVDGGAIASEHVRKAIEKLAVPHEKSPFQHLSVSIGVAAEQIDDPCWLRLVTAADEALYGAKNSGRNRVEAARDWALEKPAEELESEGEAVLA